MKNALTFILILLTTVGTVSAQMRVHLINVGQGSATLIEFPCAAILVDVGGEKNAMFNSTEALKEYLDDFFERRTDLHFTLQCVYLTHPHKDHTLGMTVLLDSPYIIKNAVTDGLEEGSGRAGQIKLHRAAQDAEATPDTTDDIGFDAVTTDEIGITGLTNKVIDPVNCGSTDPRIKILWGASPRNPGWGITSFNDENNHSLVIRVEYGSSSLLITGDLEEIAQHSLLTKYNGTDLLDADVYLVGHHGSRNGTTQELLNRISPQMALIGVGDPTREIPWTAWAYGHPNKGILDMLEQTLTLPRSPIRVQAANGARKFVDYTVSKAIYATSWDNNVVIEADDAGHWRKVDTMLVPRVVNVNTATLFDLETLPGIGTVRAQAILNFRAAHGAFTKIEDLDQVPGIGPITLELLRPYVRF